MIYINMGGRLGNQMFRYAFARQLQKHNPNELLIYNFDEVHRDKYLSGFFNENQLEYFNTVGTELQDSLNYSIPQYIVWKIYNRFYPRGGNFDQRDSYEHRWVRVLEFFGLYYLNLGYYPFTLKKPWWVKNLIVNGAFECEKYFEGCEEELREQFIPIKSIKSSNQSLMSQIIGNNSVAISIRRGDFVDNKKVRDTYFVCNMSYYEKAIEKMRELVDNPVFVFFSNDIDWVKQNFHVEGCQCYYESGNDEVWETLRLMSSCKHFIISNSTLHWWAQFLSQNLDKKVIAPSRWYNDSFKSQLYQDNWELIEV